MEKIIPKFTIDETVWALCGSKIHEGEIRSIGIDREKTIYYTTSFNTCRIEEKELFSTKEKLIKSL